MILEPMSIQSPQRARKTMAELRLRRLIEHNARLKEDLIRPRIPVSQASQSLIDYCKTTRDPLLPSVWGELRRGEDPYAPPDAGCCSGECED